MLRSLSLLVALSLTANVAAAQSAPIPAPPPPPTNGAMSPPPPTIDRGTPIELSGTVARFLINPNGDVDGLLLQDGTQVTTPPPLSATLTAALRSGDRIRISGYRVGTLSLIDENVITNDAGRIVVADAPMPPPPPANSLTLEPMQSSGVIDRVIYGPRGDVAGVLLHDGTELRLSRPAADQVGNLLQPGSVVSARGFGVQTPYGRAFEVTAMGRDSASEQTVTTPPSPAGAPPPPPSAD